MRLHRRLRRDGPADRGAGADDRRLAAPTRRSAARCSSAPPATPAGRTACPHVDVESLAVYTNNPPCGAMRGFGANQAHFAMEGCLDLLAAKVGLDRWEMRWRNALEVGDMFTHRPGAREVGRHQARRCWRVKPALRRGAARPARAVGIACGIKNSGIGNGVRGVGQGAGWSSKPTARSRSTTATPRWGRGCSRCWSSSRWR